MAKRRKDDKLYPRSFLATLELDGLLEQAAAERGMKKSQLIRQALTEWLLYQGVEKMRKRRGKT